MRAHEEATLEGSGMPRRSMAWTRASTVCAAWWRWGPPKGWRLGAAICVCVCVVS